MRPGILDRIRGVTKGISNPVSARTRNPATTLAHVILGFDRDENLFLDDEGWKANYVPAILDRGPFLIGFQNQDVDGTVREEPVIHIDMDDPRVGVDDGQAVFLPFGGDSPYLEKVMRTLQVIHQGATRDKTLFPLLESMDLLQPVSIEVTLSNVEQVNLNDYHSINAERLGQLDGESLDKLNKQGALSLAFLCPVFAVEHPAPDYAQEQEVGNRAVVSRV